MLAPLEAPLRDLLRDRLLAAGSANLIHIDGHWLTGEEVLAGQWRYANLLRDIGVPPNARVGVLLPNNEAFLLTWFATVELNLTLVPINVRLIGDSLRHIVEHADLAALIVDESTLANVRSAFGERRPCRILVIRGASAVPEAANLELLLNAASAEPPPREPVQRSDPALIIYTSGTTALPKGVVLSRAAQRVHGLSYGLDFVRLGPGESGYTCLPLFHVTSMGFTLGCLLGGSRIAIDARFDPFGFWDQIRRHEARMFPYVGAMIAILQKRPHRSDDAQNPALRAIGAATPLYLWEPFEQRFGVELIETYGQTELASLWFMAPPEGRRVGTVGRPVPRMDVRLQDAGGREPAAGMPGEILVRPHDPLLMMQSYFRDSEATANALRDGWYHTGDAATVDADGYYRFAGRLKDFIRRRGENISALEIEQALLSHPRVQECAAVGIPDELSEEEIKLCVVPVPDAHLLAADVAHYLRPRLAPFMQPRYIEIRSSLPRTATERVQKHRLVEEHAAEAAWDRRRQRN